jgi:transposase
VQPASPAATATASAATARAGLATAMASRIARKPQKATPLRLAGLHSQDRPGGCWSGPGRAWPGSPAVAFGFAGASRGRPGADRRAAGPDRPAGLGDSSACPAWPADQGAHPASGRGPVHRAGHPRRGGRHHRFGSARKLASWAGLTPAVRGSDRIAHYGHISKQGWVWLRWVLCEAAQTAKRHPQLAASYQAIAKRRARRSPPRWPPP